jgi:5-methylcytosine-specific restriction enzyme A
VVDRRSPEAQLYRKLYKTARWQRLRERQLAEHPLCERCLKRRRVTAATVVHHVEAHRGDTFKFFGGPFESSCAECHDRDAQSEERIGYSREIGADGWPVDPRHPQHRCRAAHGS